MRRPCTPAFLGRPSRPLVNPLAWLALLGIFVVVPVPARASIATVPLPPQGTFLHTNNDPDADTTLVVDLQLLGIRNGWLLRLERLGDYTFFDSAEPDSDYATAVLGAFSFDGVVLPASSGNRIPAGLLSSLPAFASAATLFGNQVTDIPVDFLISDSVYVRVPLGAKFLAVGTHDVYFGDNRDPDGDLALRITVIDTTGPPQVDCIWNVTSATSLPAGDLTHEDCVVIVNGATLTVAGTHRFAALSVMNNGVVTTASLDSLRLTVTGDVQVEATGRISVDGRGYAAGQGPGASAGGSVGSYTGGAAHGGEGGNGFNSAGSQAVYGVVMSPTGLGSGAGNVTGASGGSGGGAIRLTVGGELKVDGVISANANSGANGSGTSGGGSGGSVWLSVGSLTGTGVVSANGGDSPINPTSLRRGGGGGGGRIAISTYCWPVFSQPQLSVDGGAGFEPGDPGTIYPSLGAVGIAAGVVATAGDMRTRRLPDDFLEGSLESDDSLWVVRERGGALLPPAGGIQVDITEPGTVVTGSQFTPGTISGGTLVNSHLLHFDPAGTSSGLVSGSITFDTDVLGIIVSSVNLDSSDALLHAPGLEYPGGLLVRGAEFSGASEQDAVTLSEDRRTVTFVASVASGLDQIRIVTAVPVGSCGAVSVDPDAPGEHGAPPQILAFAPPSPNPMRTSTTLHFDLPVAGQVSLDVFDLSGRRIAALIEGVLPAGRHTRVWDGLDRNGARREPGLYFVRLTTVTGRRSQRITLTR